MAAKSSKLGTLHELITEMFINDIKLCQDEGIPMSASDKAVIVKFLKDNDITAVIDDAKMKELSEEFADELSKKRAERVLQLVQQTEEDELLQGLV
ncbi:terminase small subunit [Aeromonas phage vB_AspA_Lolek]|nr:terminase small subunit [Aeromonas phage vB_AspA_Lolek]